MAGETTVAAPSGLTCRANSPPSCSTIGICCKASAHWKYWRLCNPLRSTKWPSNSAPLSRKICKTSVPVMAEW